MVVYSSAKELLEFRNAEATEKGPGLQADL